MKPTVSVTQRTGAGGIGAGAADTSDATPRSPQIAQRKCLNNSELHFWRFFGAGSGFEEFLLLETTAEETRHQYGGKALAHGVEVLSRFIEAHPLRGNPVFG